MYVMSAANALPPSALPGIAHRTLARRGDGLDRMSVWKQTMTPGNSTPPHHHDCDEVVVVLAGQGTLLIEGQSLPFQAGDTLLLPAGRDHQIVNTGDRDVVTVAAFAASPVATALPGGQVIDLPWAS
ncbi:MAG TPA: cupin domain-containing protein [Gammaproteobacteria bacterium]|jgi:quercetin dioxygenase-like cupin family protein|nr:cupin domain-containing protein [Gammaproteobacteria bacterium]